VIISADFDSYWAINGKGSSHGQTCGYSACRHCRLDADGAASLMNTTATLGLMKRFYKRDLLGLGFNWGDPSNEGLRDQYSTELFYRFQFAENLAVTPSLQWLVDPANNTEEDQIWVAGLRFRLTL